MRNGRAVIKSGAFFLHPGNQLFVQQPGAWTGNRRSALSGAVVKSILTMTFVGIALSYSYRALTAWTLNAVLEMIVGWLFCLFLAALSQRSWRDYSLYTHLERHGTLIYGQILEVSREIDDGNLVVKYAFETSSGSQITNTERGSGKFPDGDTTGIYILYCDHEIYAAL